MSKGLDRGRLRWLIGVATATTLLVAGGMWSVASAQQSPQTWQAYSGFATTDGHVFSNDFQPRPLEIRVGDTVTWKNNGFHTIAFGRDRVLPFNPGNMEPNIEAVAPMGGASFNGQGVVQSGFLEGPADFSVTFTAAGSYRYVCDIHPNMDGTVVVKAAGEPLAMTPEQANAFALDHFYRADFSTRALPLIIAGADVAVPSENLVQLSAGTGDGHVEVALFLPRSLVVRVGDVVQWVNRDPETPHTVTFLPGGGLPDMSGPPPEGFAGPFVAVGGTEYSGAELINSGALWRDPRFQPASVGDTFSMTFTAPGTYQYFCILHAPGMAGTVTVLP